MIEKRDWDSTFFGYEVGCCYIKSNESFDFELLVKEASAFKLIYIFSDSLLPYSNLLKLVDTKVTWEKECSEELLSPNIQEFQSTLFSYDELLDLALLSGRYSRFNADDRFLNNEFFRLYKEWLDKSLNKEIAEKVFINYYERKINGFITVAKRSIEKSSIGLISVNPQFQGQRIASNLIKYASNYSLNQGFKNIEVITQKDNLAAMKLYEKNLFKIKSIQYIYHLWNQ